ncbi:tetratricopeptide repeat protein [Candidatus Peregrinibacteria bacterium]|nr:tetratricopeptide repeat protein [Candidatus Peregrinibacteria bacterium]
MRKFLAFISAILLAFLVTASVLAWQGIELTKEGILSLFEKEEERVLPLLPQTDEPEEELNLTYEEYLEKGDYYFERGFLTFASNQYVRAANLEPNRIDPYLKLLKTHLELRNYKKALSNAELVLQINPDHPETRFDMIRIYIKLSDFDTAKNLLDSYPVTAAPDPRVTYYKGLLSALFGNHELAQKYLKEAAVASNDPDLSTKINMILEAYREFSFTKAAEELYLSELLARSFNKVTEYEMAVHLLKEVLRERGDLRDGWILLGFAYLNLEKYQFALTAFEKAYSLDSEWPTTQYFLGVTHKELGHFEDAIVFFNFALSNDFEPALVVYRHLADLYFETENYEKSAEAYEKVLDLSKDDVSSFVRPIWLYLDFINQPQKALKLAETAALTFPDSAMSYNLLGWSYAGLGEDQDAEKNLKRALAIDPNLAAAYYNLGNLYRSQGRDNMALEVFQKAYDLDSSGSIGNLAAQAYNELLKKTLSN